MVSRSFKEMNNYKGMKDLQQLRSFLLLYTYLSFPEKQRLFVFTWLRFCFVNLPLGQVFNEKTRATAGETQEELIQKP